jgi:hypothetical protein
MRKILVMIPAGETYDHDCVRWYRAHDVQRSIDHYHNIGDAFVHDSSLKLLDFDRVDALEIRNVDAAAIERANAECDFCFLRGSNYIHAQMNWQATAEVLERLRIPVIALGVGAQAPAHGRLELSDESLRVWRLIAERCETVGVRGDYTAEVLWDVGVRNLRVIGCPTLFRARNPDLRIDLPPLDSVERVAFTLRREVSATYARDIERYLGLQKQVIADLVGRFAEVTVSAQGEIEEKKIVFGTDEQREQAVERLTAACWLDGPDGPLTALYRTRLFYSDVVADYDAMVRRHQLTLGYRLHGNLIALANGIPSIYFTYDSRTAEFADTFKIPAFDVFAGEAFELERYWDQALFERFNRAYRHGWREMCAFLDENGVAHRLGGGRTAAPAPLAA